MFQFTPLREGRRLWLKFNWMIAISFNSRPCERGDPCSAAPIAQNTRFQFTPLREGRQGKDTTQQKSRSSFNSRPCERGDSELPKKLCGNSEFQFTPLREGRLAHLRIISCCCLRFNSRPCERGDLFSLYTQSNIPIVSIHAPARGATLKHFISCRYRNLFQFTPLREGRQHI